MSRCLAVVTLALALAAPAASAATRTGQADDPADAPPSLSEQRPDIQHSATTAAHKQRVAEMLAQLDRNRPVEANDPLVRRFQHRLDQLTMKCHTTEIRISDLTVRAQELLRDDGIKQSLYRVITGVNRGMATGSRGMRCVRTFAAYVTLQKRLAGHRTASAARTIDCGNFDLIRWTHAPIVGAGIYDVRARGVGCRAARRVARHFGLGSADGYYRGFRCRNTARATELVRARCTRHGQVITWEAGA